MCSLGKTIAFFVGNPVRITEAQRGYINSVSEQVAGDWRSDGWRLGKCWGRDAVSAEVFPESPPFSEPHFRVVFPWGGLERWGQVMRDGEHYLGRWGRGTI